MSSEGIVSTSIPGLTFRFGTEGDVTLILGYIRELAEYERLAHAVVASEEELRESLFGARRRAEVILADHEGAPAGFALFFHNFSTFVGRAGLYLEDLFVRPHLRGLGIGKELLRFLARLAEERRCGRFEWAVLDWNEPAIGFYKSLGARPMDDWTVFRLEGAALHALAGEWGRGVTPVSACGRAETSPRRVVERWVEAFNRADADGLADMYAEDAINHQVAEEPVEGRDAIRAMFGRGFASATMVCIVENIFEDGEWAILEWRDPLGLRGCGFFRVADGRIAFQRGYWDRLTFLRQHGLPLPVD